MSTSDIIQSIRQNLINAYNSLQTKGATIPQNKNIANLKDSIDSIQTGGGETVSNGVFFMDYDGTIVETWDVASVASKTELPTNPTHTGLVAEGWNWTLQSIKNYLEDYPEANVYVGQTYHTVSGLSEFDVTMTKVTGKTITFNMVGNKDWGDGTNDNLTEHTYEDYGDYTITCDGTSIPIKVFNAASSNINRYWCTAIRLSSRITVINNNAFNNCRSLKSVTIPDGAINTITISTFSNCYSLKSITIPDGVTSISSSFNNCYSLISISIPDDITDIGGSAFSSCYSLTGITISDGVKSIGANAFNKCYSLKSITIPDGVTSISSAFSNCYSLKSITIPDGVTSISSAFSNCYALTNVNIPDGVTNIVSAFSGCYSLKSINIPDGVTSISGAFSNCYALTNVNIPDGVTSVGSSAFSNCYSLKSITIPDGVTDISNNVFTSCYSLTNVNIPDSVTSIGSAAFSGCYSLKKSITIPDGVTDITNSTFTGCHSVLKYDFTNAKSILTLSNTNAFTDINGICKIIVPDALYDDWVAATNWSTYANYIYKASEVA